MTKAGETETGKADAATTAASSATVTGTRTSGSTVTGLAVTSAGARRRRFASAVVHGDRLLRAIRARTARMSRAVLETLTPAGRFAAAAAVVGIAVGWPLGWVEWLAAGLAAAVMTAIAGVFLLGRVRVTVEFEVPAARVVAGDPLSGVLAVRNASGRLSLPARVEIPVAGTIVHEAVPLLRPGAEHHRRVDIPAQRRGVVAVGPVVTVRRDPLELLRREQRWTRVQRIFVHPRTVVPPEPGLGFLRDLEGRASTRLVDSDIAFHAIRDYEPGDLERNVHWKSTAKTGRLMVRQYEETRRSKTAVLLGLRPDEYAGDDEFELAVSAAASVAVRAVMDGREVIVGVSEEVPEAARRVIQSMRLLATTGVRPLLDDFAAVTASNRCLRLPEVCALAQQRFPDVSTAILVIGTGCGPKQLERCALEFAEEVRVVALQSDWQSAPAARRLRGLTALRLGSLNDVRPLLAGGVRA